METSTINATYIDIDIANKQSNKSNEQSNKQSNKQKHIDVSTIPNFTHLILGGGGFMGAVYMGVFSYLYQEPELIKNIKTVVGTSIGSVFATAFVLNIPMKEIEMEWKKIFNKDTKLYDINLLEFLNLFNTLGLDDGTRGMLYIKNHVKQMTFLDLAKKTGKDLIICATNALNMKATYFSVNTTPNVLVIDAVSASCAIPFILKPIKIGDTYYIDGCITDDLPIKIIPKNIPKDNILIISLSSCDIPETKELSLPLLITNIVSTYIRNPGLINIYEKNYKYYIPIKDIPINSINYIIENENMYICEDIVSMDKCFEIGYETLYLKIKEWTKI